MESNKVVNRLQMMYGQCLQLSDKAALVYRDDTFVLFKIEGTGAKELGSGKILQPYIENKQLVLKTKDCSLYDFDGNKLNKSDYSTILRMPNGMFLVRNKYRFGIVNSLCRPINGLPFRNHITVFDNGLAKLTEGESTEWINWMHLDKEGYKRLTCFDPYKMYNDLLVIQYREYNTAKAYNLQLQELGSLDYRDWAQFSTNEYILDKNDKKLYTGGLGHSWVSNFGVYPSTTWASMVENMKKSKACR